MKTVLLAWELGAGFGHVVSLRRVAAPLAAHGFRCIAAVKNIAAAASLAADGIAVVQAPLWKPAKSSVSLGDVLGDGGLADPQTLRPMLDAWLRIVDDTKPDLVIADYAPAASLAVRGRIPLALIGTGYSLPPPEMPVFPLLHRAAPPVWQEQFLLDTANSVLADLKLQGLRRLPELFSSDASWVYTFPLLDPYARWRWRTAQGPDLQILPKPRADNAAEILVYLSSWPGMQRPFIEALRPFAGKVRLFASGYSDSERARYASWGMRIETAPFRFGEDLAGAQLAIHLGSEGTASMCVMAGVPQLACAIDIEKELNGKALTQAGIGKFLPMYRPSISLTDDIVAEMLADRALAAQAREVGEDHRARYRDAEPLPDFVAECAKLLA